MSARYTIGLDYGTNSVRALIVNVANGAEVATAVWGYSHGTAGVILSRDPNLARQHPADYLKGAEVTINDMTMQVLNLTRPADDIIAAGNMFNSEADEGNEYIIVSLSVTCDKGTDDTCSFSVLSDFTLTGSSGSVRDAEWMISGVDSLFEETEFYGGATVEGGLAFQVDQEETDLILIYEPLFATSKAYLAVE